jgi:FAD/FMN-containing dehydrogenase
MHFRNNRPSRRDVLSAGAVGAAWLLGREANAQQRVIMNDASRLNPTPVIRHWQPKSDPAKALVDELRSELKSAASANRSVVVGAARHSMGAQSLPRDGLAITFDSHAIEPDTKAGVYRVSAGTRWSDVIRALDAIGFGPAVMQSNADFGVAATFSVNAHGWPVPYGPFGSTVRSLRMMLANGEVVECSRQKNPELFSLAMGGYGLVGIILDLDVEMTKNVLLARKLELVSPSDFGRRFVQSFTDDPSVQMAYGRLSVGRNEFFRDALLVTWQPVATQPETLPPAASSSWMSGVSRQIYRAQIGSETAKRARWIAETKLDPRVASGQATRNSLMNEPVANLANRDLRRTDILHEYFVPPDRFGDFIEACRNIIPQARAEFLNVTLRYVAADALSTLAFAPQPRIAAVMSFSQEVTPEAEVDMIQVTERLIDAVVGLGGSFYLPYRLHARRDQVTAAYPNAFKFGVRKRYYDPRMLFRHAMWDTYFA